MANFTISQNSGTGVTVIQVTPSGQNLTYSARTSTITISDGTTTKNVLVKQNGLPHTVPALDVVNANNSQQNILFTVESDFTIQFSGYNPGNSWATIWDYDSGEQLDQYDHYDPEDLAHTTFALRLTQNRTGNDRQMTIYMKHVYNNAGEIETAPYVYSMNIYQGAGLSIPYSISCAFEEGEELDGWLYIYDTQNQLIDAVELLLTEGNDYTGTIGNGQLTTGQSIRIMFWNGGGIEPVYTKMKYTGSWTSESALYIGDDLTISGTMTVGTTLYIDLAAGEQ